MAIFLSDKERARFKSVLAVAFEDNARLNKEIIRATREAKAHAGDHQSAVLGTYASLLKEIERERNTPFTRPKDVVTMPSIEELKGKFLDKGPKR